MSVWGDRGGGSRTGQGQPGPSAGPSSSSPTGVAAPAGPAGQDKGAGVSDAAGPSSSNPTTTSASTAGGQPTPPTGSLHSALALGTAVLLPTSAPAVVLTRGRGQGVSPSGKLKLPVAPLSPGGGAAPGELAPSPAGAHVRQFVGQRWSPEQLWVQLVRTIIDVNFSDNHIPHIPASIGKLQHLRSLSLRRNNLQGLPHSMSLLKGLERLDLRWNQLTKLPASFCQLRSLRHLFLSNNRVQALPSRFGSLETLLVLDLSSNPLSHLPDSFARLINLEALSLNSTKLAEVPAVLYFLPALCSLSFVGNQQCRRFAPLPGHYAVDTGLYTLPSTGRGYSHGYRYGYDPHGQGALLRAGVGAPAPTSSSGSVPGTDRDGRSGPRSASPPPPQPPPAKRFARAGPTGRAPGQHISPRGRSCRPVVLWDKLEVFFASDNALTSIPASLGLCVPHLRVLDLSRNYALTEFPAALFFECVQLVDLDLSYNRLEYFVGQLPADAWLKAPDRSKVVYLRTAESAQTPVREYVRSPADIHVVCPDRCRVLLPVRSGPERTDLLPRAAGEGVASSASPRSRVFPVPGKVLSAQRRYQQQQQDQQQQYQHQQRRRLSTHRVGRDRGSSSSPDNRHVDWGLGSASTASDSPGGRSGIPWPKLALRRLQLSHNSLLALANDLFPPGMTTLVDLDVSYNQLTWLPESLEMLTGLVRLNVSHNLLSSQLPPGVLHTLNWECLGELRELDLSHNCLTTLPGTFSGLRELRVLNLRANALHGLPSGVLRGLVSLRVLRLDHNFLARLPAELGLLKRLDTLHASHNQLRDIPGELGSLSHLQRLYLDHNKLCDLPCSLGTGPAHRSLERVDLFSNAALVGNPIHQAWMQGLEVLFAFLQARAAARDQRHYPHYRKRPLPAHHHHHHYHHHSHHRSHRPHAYPYKRGPAPLRKGSGSGDGKGGGGGEASSSRQSLRGLALLFRRGGSASALSEEDGRGRLQDAQHSKPGKSIQCTQNRSGLLRALDAVATVRRRTRRRGASSTSTSASVSGTLVHPSSGSELSGGAPAPRITAVPVLGSRLFVNRSRFPMRRLFGLGPGFGPGPTSPHSQPPSDPGSGSGRVVEASAVGPLVPAATTLRRTMARRRLGAGRPLVRGRGAVGGAWGGLAGSGSGPGGELDLVLGDGYSSSSTSRGRDRSSLFRSHSFDSRSRMSLGSDGTTPCKGESRGRQLSALVTDAPTVSSSPSGSYISASVSVSASASTTYTGGLVLGPAALFGMLHGPGPPGQGDGTLTIGTASSGTASHGSQHRGRGRRRSRGFRTGGPLGSRPPLLLPRPILQRPAIEPEPEPQTYTDLLIHAADAAGSASPSRSTSSDSEGWGGGASEVVGRVLPVGFGASGSQLQGGYSRRPSMTDDFSSLHIVLDTPTASHKSLGGGGSVTAVPHRSPLPGTAADATPSSPLQPSGRMATRSGPMVRAKPALPDLVSLEVSPSQITVLEKAGEGAFGQVYRATLRTGREVRTIALKTFKTFSHTVSDATAAVWPIESPKPSAHSNSHGKTSGQAQHRHRSPNGPGPQPAGPAPRLRAVSGASALKSGAGTGPGVSSELGVGTGRNPDSDPGTHTGKSSARDRGAALAAAGSPPNWKNKVQLRHRSVVQEMGLRRLRREVGLLARARHPNIVELLGTCLQPPNLAILTEYVRGYSLGALIWHYPQSITTGMKRSIPLQVARGMAYLHSLNIMHRDLSSNNILIDLPTGTAKVCDFGLARAFPSRLGLGHGVRGARSLLTHQHDATLLGFAGSVRWVAPEVLRGEPYDRKADVYSFGIVLWSILYKQKPYAPLRRVRQIGTLVAYHLLRPDIDLRGILRDGAGMEGMFLPQPRSPGAIGRLHPPSHITDQLVQHVGTRTRAHGRTKPDGTCGTVLNGPDSGLVATEQGEDDDRGRGGGADSGPAPPVLSRPRSGSSGRGLVSPHSSLSPLVSGLGTPPSLSSFARLSPQRAAALSEHPAWMLALMRQCWHENPALRPTFHEITMRFEFEMAREGLNLAR